MTRQGLIKACIRTAEVMKASLIVPRDTGNLARNGIRYEIKDDAFILYVDEAIAPYMPYTNEPWTAERWHGKKNPNEGWWDDFADAFANGLATNLRGVVE